jgi:membrane protein implicated in regulation of membrane protease activity
MKQSKKESLIEACTNTGVGFLTTLIFSYPIYYWFGVKINTSQLAGVTVLFTIISIVRSYIIRRWFNNLQGVKNKLKRIFIKQQKL